MQFIKQIRFRQLALMLAASGISAAAFAAGGVPAKPIPTEPLVQPGDTQLVELPEVLRDLRGIRADDKTNAPYVGPYTAATDRPGFPVSAAQLARDAKLKVSDFRIRSVDRAALGRLAAKAARGPVDVMVTLKMLMTPEGLLSDAEASGQRGQIARLQDAVLAALSGREHKLLYRYQYVPQLSIKLDARALELLANLPDVADIQEVELSAPDLADSGPIVGSADLLERGVSGSGWVVAVLDTGIDRNHPFLRSFVAESCYSGNGNCPNGTTRQTGAGAAAACTFAPSACSHGSHVAGIATGASQAGFTSLEGIARGARVMPIQVFTQFTGTDCTNFGLSSPCALSRVDDQVAALEYVYSQRFNYSIAAANMSLGGGRNTGFCDSDSRKPIIDNLRAAGIATVIAAGNDGYTDAVSTPGCISSAVVVGATNKDDTVASYSNSVNYLDMFAPGSNITSSVPTNAFGIKSGTSMATPHVAGAWALLQSQQNRSVADTRALLLNSGKSITDTRSGAGNRVKPRIDVLAAANLNNVTLTDFVPREYRQPRPIAHGYNYAVNRSYWSAVAVRPDNAGLDVDLQLFDLGIGNGLLGSSAAGAGTIDVIAQDNNSGRRAQGVDYPQAAIFGTGTGRYRIELSNPGIVLGSSLNDVMDGTHVLRIYDAAVTAGVTQYVRVVPTGVNDLELMAFTSTTDAATWVRPRSSAVISSSGGTGVAEAVSFTPTVSGYAGIVVTSKIGGFGGYTVYNDTTAPVGSVAINNGAATTTSPQVTLSLSASDPQTGILDMRVATDGVADSEAWEPYATSKTVTLPSTPGVKTVAVQFRNNAGQVSQPFTDTIEIPAPLPTISINDVQINEGNSGTSIAIFTLSLSAASQTNVTVNYATSNGTATFGSDYVAEGDTASFAAGQVSRTVAFSIKGDTVVEPNETFFVNLSSPNGATISRAQGIGTIVNDDIAAGVPGIGVQTRSFNFGSVRVGTSSPQRSLVITSTGTAPLLITGIRLSGDYNGSSNCPRSLAPGATCALTGTFKPTATGARPGSVTITSNAPDSPTVIQLSGTGI